MNLERMREICERYADRQNLSMDDWCEARDDYATAFSPERVRLLLRIAELANEVPWCLDPFQKRPCGQCNSCKLSTAFDELEALGSEGEGG